MTWSRVLGSTTNTWTGRTKLIGIMILQYDLLESVLHLNSDSKTWNDDLRDSSRLQTEFNKSQSDRSHRQVKFFVCVEFEEVPTIHKAAYLPYAHNRQSSPSKIVLNLNQNLKATKAGFPALIISWLVPPAISRPFHWVQTSKNMRQSTTPRIASVINKIKNYIIVRTYYKICRLLNH